MRFLDCISKSDEDISMLPARQTVVIVLWLPDRVLIAEHRFDLNRSRLAHDGCDRIWLATAPSQNWNESDTVLDHANTNMWSKHRLSSIFTDQSVDPAIDLGLM